jgi:hypothetical protein
MNVMSSSFAREACKHGKPCKQVFRLRVATERGGAIFPYIASPQFFDPKAAEKFVKKLFLKVLTICAQLL